MPIADLITGVKDILANQRNYDIAEDYYEGDTAEIFASANMKRRLGPMSGAYKVNLANTPVDVLAERLEITSVSVPDNPAANTALQEKIWTTDIRLDVKDWLRQTGEFGDGLLFVWPTHEADDVDPESESDLLDASEADNEEPDEPDGADAVDLIWNSPKTGRVIYDAENNAYPIFAIKFWQDTTKKTYRATLYYPDTIERYIAKDELDPKDASSWKEYVDSGDLDDNGQAPWPIDNPYGKIPLFHLRNAKPYGRPEHKGAYGPQNALNKLIPAHMSTVDFQSFPQRYALTETNAPGEDEDDGTEWFPDDNMAQTVSQQDRSKLKAGPGELWWMNNVREVGQFAPADSKVFTDPMPLYVKLMAQTTKTPLHYFDPSGDSPSGESLRAADSPMLKKAEDRQQRYGSTLSAALSFALEILGFPDCRVEIQWATAGIADDHDSWETTQLKIDAGVPVRRALMEAGYTETELDAFGLTGDESDIVMKRKVAILAMLAAAGQGFAALSAFEIFDNEAIKAVFEDVLSPATS